jgi:hypothetical protein
MSDKSISEMEKEIADLKKENEELKARLKSLERSTDLKKAAAALALKSRFTR